MISLCNEKSNGRAALKANGALRAAVRSRALAPAALCGLDVDALATAAVRGARRAQEQRGLRRSVVDAAATAEIVEVSGAGQGCPVCAGRRFAVHRRDGSQVLAWKADRKSVVLQQCVACGHTLRPGEGSIS